MSTETAYSYQAPDQLIYNLLTGADAGTQIDPETGKSTRLGLLPLVEQYYLSQFQGLGGPDTSPFTYTDPRIASFSPREELAMKLADQGIGAFQPYFARASGLTEEALATLAGGTSEAKDQVIRALQQGEDYTRAGLESGVDFTTDAIRKAAEAEGGLRGSLDQAEALAREAQKKSDPFITEGIEGVRAGRDAELAGVQEAAQAARRAEGLQDPFIDEASQLARASTAGFDVSDIDRYMNPFEDRVVQQTIDDIKKASRQQDIAASAAEVTSGAFGGSRSRLGAQERQIAETKGLADALAGIRSRGFEGARGAAMGEFGRQRGAEAGAAGTMAGLGAQKAAGATGLASLLGGFAGQEGGARRGSAAEIAGLGGQRGANLERLASNIAGFGGQEYSGRMGTSGALSSGGQQLYGMTTGAGQAMADRGMAGADRLSGLAGGLAAGQERGAGAYSGYAATLPGLQQGDVSNLMNVGAMNRARNQALLDLNYQNFVGQYNLPQQLMSGYANFLTGAGPLAGGTGYSGTSPMQPFTNMGTGYASYGAGMKEGGRPIPNKGLAALAKKAPEVVRKMGFNPAKAQRGGLASRFPMSSRKLGTA